MGAFTDWINRNPVIFSVIIWPTLTGLITYIFKPRTPEQYASMSPRLVGFLKTIGSLGIDAPTLIGGVKEMTTGHVTPAKEYREAQVRAMQASMAPPPMTTTITTVTTTTPDKDPTHKT